MRGSGPKRRKSHRPTTGGEGNLEPPTNHTPPPLSRAEKWRWVSLGPNLHRPPIHPPTSWMGSHRRGVTCRSWPTPQQDQSLFRVSSTRARVDPEDVQVKRRLWTTGSTDERGKGGSNDPSCEFAQFCQPTGGGGAKEQTACGATSEGGGKWCRGIRWSEGRERERGCWVEVGGRGEPYGGCGNRADGVGGPAPSRRRTVLGTHHSA